MKIFDNQFAGLEKAMELRFKRHVTLTGNLSNSETPNFRAREVDFAGELQRAFGDAKNDVKKTSPRHMDIGEANGNRLIFDDSGAMGADGNNVDLDVTMGKISANARDYESAGSYMAQKLKLLRLFVRRA